MASVARQRDVADALRSAEAICSRRRARFTPFRRLIFELLAASVLPPTGQEILNRVHPLDASATAAGVYRSLKFLTDHGLIHRIESAKAFIACAMPGHSHPSRILVCRLCRKTIEIDDPSIDWAVGELDLRLGFSFDHKTVELIGVCETCRD